MAARRSQIGAVTRLAPSNIQMEVVQGERHIINGGASTFAWAQQEEEVQAHHVCEGKFCREGALQLLSEQGPEGT